MKKRRKSVMFVFGTRPEVIQLPGRRAAFFL